MSRSIRLIGSLLATVFALAPSSALASTEVASPSGGAVTGLAVAGAEVLYVVSPGCSSPGITPCPPTQLFSAAPGRSPRLLFTLPPLSDEAGVGVAASPAGVVLARNARGRERDLDVDASQLFAGPLGGPLEPLALCGRGPAVASADVDGDLQALQGVDCVPDRTVIRDLGRGGRTVRTIDGPGAVVLGGRWLARVREITEAGVVRRAVSVEDARTGDVLTDLRLDDLVFGLDVQDDGTAVLQRPSEDDDAVRGPCDSRVTVVAPGAATTQDLPGRVCATVPARIARDRVAYARVLGRYGEELVVSSRSGGDVRAVARFPDTSQLEEVVYDGERVAWLESRCLGGNTLRVASASEAATPYQAPRCSPRIGRSLRVRGRYVRVPLSCPRGCVGRLGIERPTFVQAGRSPRFRIRPGGSATVRIALSRRGLAVLRRRGALRVTLSTFEAVSRDTPAVLRAR